MLAVDERHRAAQEALQLRLRAALGQLVAAWPSLSEDVLRGYHGSAYPLVAGGQQASARLAAGYGLYLTRTRAPGALDVAGALRTSGVGVTPESRSLVAPVLRARRLMSEGADMDEALVGATAEAERLGSLDLLAAQRVGLEQGVGAGGARVHGYSKVLSGGACEWCRKIAEDTGRYHSPDSVPFHAHDRCSVRPVLEAEREHVLAEREAAERERLAAVA